MPKEVIHHGQKYVIVHHPETENVGAWDEEIEYKYPIADTPTSEFVDQNPEGSTIATHPTLEIAWSKPGDWFAYNEDPEGFVQVGLSVDRVEILRVAKELEKDPMISAHGFFTRKISRAQINNAIRVLKRARNGAFGVDE